MILDTIAHAAYRNIAFTFYVCMTPYRLMWRVPKYFASMFWELLSGWVRSYSSRMLKNGKKRLDVSQNSKSKSAGKATFYDENVLSMWININLIVNLSNTSPFALISWFLHLAHLSFLFGPCEKPKNVKIREWDVRRHGRPEFVNTKRENNIQYDELDNLPRNPRFVQYNLDGRNVCSKEGVAMVTKRDDALSFVGSVIDKGEGGPVHFITDSEEEESESDSSFGMYPYTKNELLSTWNSVEGDDESVVEGSPVWQSGRPVVVGTPADTHKDVVKYKYFTYDTDDTPEIPTSVHDSDNGWTSEEEDEDEEESTSEEAFSIQPPDFAETMQMALESEIYQLNNRLDHLNCAVHRLHTTKTDPLDQLFEGVPVTAEFEDYRKLISEKTQDGMSPVYVRDNDLQDWGIKNAHHRNLLTDRIQQHAEEYKTDYLEELFKTFMPTPTFRSYQQAFRNHKVAENELKWIDDQALRAFGVESQVHRELIMHRVEEFIDGRNFLSLLFKELPQDHEFRFYHMVFEHHGVTEKNISNLSHKDLISMGIVNEVHRKILLRHIVQDVYSVRGILHQDDEDEELEDTDSLGSDFMDEAYHTPKTSVASSDEFYLLNPPPKIYFAN